METNEVEIDMGLTDEYIKELKDKHMNIGDVIQLSDVRELVTRAHHGQILKYSLFPYYTHSFAVADNFTSVIYRIVAISHGLLGDTELTSLDLEEFGYSEIMVDTIKLLTRSEDESYLAHLMNLAPMKTARRIKIADIEHNMLNMESGNLFDKYSLAIHILMEYERHGNNR